MALLLSAHAASTWPPAGPRCCTRARNLRGCASRDVHHGTWVWGDYQTARLTVEVGGRRQTVAAGAEPPGRLSPDGSLWRPRGGTGGRSGSPSSTSAPARAGWWRGRTGTPGSPGPTTTSRWSGSSGGRRGPARAPRLRRVGAHLRAARQPRGLLLQPSPELLTSRVRPLRDGTTPWTSDLPDTCPGSSRRAASLMRRSLVTASSSRWRAGTTAGGALVLALTLAGCPADSSTTGPTDPPPPTLEVEEPIRLLANQPDQAPLEPGRYAMSMSEAATMTPVLTVPDGYSHLSDGWAIFRTEDTGSDGYSPTIGVWEVDAVYSHPCDRSGRLEPVGPSVADLADALAAQPMRNGSTPAPVTVSGYDGLNGGTLGPRRHRRRRVPGRALQQLAGSLAARSWPGRHDLDRRRRR